MIAFVTFVKTFSIWIYLFCVLGILFGIKMLFDARRMSRTTMFSLDQERAVERTSRGLLVVVVMAALIFAVTIVIVVVSPFVPQAEPPIARGITPTLANIFPTNVPTLTPTAVITKSTETPFFTVTPQPLPVWTFTFTPPPTKSVAVVTATSPLTITLLPAPKPFAERNKDPMYDGAVVTGIGEATTRTSLIFKWNWPCDQCQLLPSDNFVVTISFVDKFTGLQRTFAGTTQSKSLTMYDIGRGLGDLGTYYQKAKDDQYQWYIQVRRFPSNLAVSLPSEAWKFYWH